MTETTFRGPVVSLGAAMDSTSNPFDGPSIDYQGSMFLDPRFSPANKDSQMPAAVPGFIYGNTVVVVDNIPSTLSSTTIAAAQVATSGTALSLQTACLGGAVAGTPCWTPGVPIIPVGTTVVQTVSAIDFGFTTGTTTAASSTVVVVDSTLLKQGAWYVIGGAGNAANTASLITQLAAITNATTVQISPVALGSLNNAPIGQGNLFGSDYLPPGTQFGPATASASGAVAYKPVGFGLAFDPVQAITRTLQVAASSSSGGAATIVATGYDVYGNAMTELFTASGTTVQTGKKAFKYIASIAPTANGTANYVVGVSDTIGIPLRADYFGSVAVTFGNNRMATAGGFTAAVTSVATNTTGDVRGTLNLQALGGAVGTSNGTARLTVVATVPLAEMRNANPTTSASLFGVTEA